MCTRSSLSVWGSDFAKDMVGLLMLSGMDDREEERGRCVKQDMLPCLLVRSGETPISAHRLQLAHSRAVWFLLVKLFSRSLHQVHEAYYMAHGLRSQSIVVAIDGKYRTLAKIPNTPATCGSRVLKTDDMQDEHECEGLGGRPWRISRRG